MGSFCAFDERVKSHPGGSSRTIKTLAPIVLDDDRSAQTFFVVLIVHLNVGQPTAAVMVSTMAC
jgi:hypothetical protein